VSPRVRSRVLFAAKVLVGTALITWLVRSGSLDFSKLGILIRKPGVLALDIGVFAMASVVGALRWRTLLSLAKVSVPFGRLLQLQLTSLFFNVVIPGNVGGDVVKALYVARGEHPSKRTTILLIGFVERLVGLAGLVFVASVVTLMRGPALWADPQLRQLAMAVGVLGALTLLGPLAFIVLMRTAGERLDKWTSGTSRISALLNQLVAALRLLASGPRQLLTALALSMMTHAAAIGLFTVLTRVILDRDVAYSAVATVFPLGILAMVVPISPAGVGVGHAAFDWLFDTIGLTGGATIFNVYLVGQVTPCLLGVFPYLALRSKGALPTDLSTEEAARPPEP
jgi:glycosyltransferase 2 family protein